MRRWIKLNQKRFQKIKGGLAQILLAIHLANDKHCSHYIQILLLQIKFTTVINYFFVYKILINANI